MKALTKSLLILVLVSTTAHAKMCKVVPTFYWPGEKGGRIDCNGNELHKGIAAVDFDSIPKDSNLTIVGDNLTLNLKATDCGGSDVIDCTASHERGFGNTPVVDIWVPSEEAALRLEERIGCGKAICYINESPKPHKPVAIHRRLYRDTWDFCSIPYSSKSSHSNAVLSPFRREEMLAEN